MIRNFTLNCIKDLFQSLSLSGFEKGGDCRLKHKSAIENFSNYIKNYGDIEIPDSRNIPSDIMDELQKLKYKKTVSNGPKYSPSMIRYSLLMYYTSPQTYKMLLETLPFPSISLLKKLSQGGIEPLKACKLLLEKGKMDQDVILSLDEMYIQKESGYNGGRVTGTDPDGKMFKGVLNSLTRASIQATTNRASHLR